MSVGENIKNRRCELHLSQQELADAMGYRTRSTIAKIESGENDVSQKKLQKFAAALNTTVEALITGNPAAEVLLPRIPAMDGAEQHKNIVLILAGGDFSSNRQNIPSQFLNIHGKPILVHCMDAYQEHPSVDDIYVVCLKGWENIVKAYANQFGITKLRGLIPAGKSGIASLKNGIDFVKDRYSPSDVVIVQEATRPMVRPETISTLLLSCGEKGSATICHSMNEYVQFDISGSKPTYVNRNSIIALQSPEAHRLSLLTELFEKAVARQHPFTESCCTMLLYKMGYDINFIECNINNIKIAREEDVAAISAMLV